MTQSNAPPTPSKTYEFAHALQITETFFWDAFADNYIELVKRRARSETDEHGRASAVATLRLGLNTLLRLFAPFVPTITDEIWSWTFTEETNYPSIHQAPWPTQPPLRDAKGTRSSEATHAGDARVSEGTNVTNNARHEGTIPPTLPTNPRTQTRIPRNVLSNRLPSDSRRPKSQTRSHRLD